MYFEYWHPESDRWKEVEAVSPEDAAERVAAHIDWNGDYCIIGGSPDYILLRRKGTFHIEIYELTGRTEPVYSAEKITREALETSNPSYGRKDYLAELDLIEEMVS